MLRRTSGLLHRISARGALAGCSALAAASASAATASPYAEAQAAPPDSSSSSSDPTVLPATVLPDAQPMFGFLPEAVRAPFDYVYDVVYENVVAPYAEPSRDKLLPDVPSHMAGKEKPTLVVSLDGTLVHSDWTRQYGWRYAKRPGVDQFLAQLAPFYEIVLWTECLNSSEHIIDKLDPLPPPRRAIRHKLYRDATHYTGGLHRKDLRALNRNLDKVLVVGCAPYEYSLQPGHGVALSEYKADQGDVELKRLLPFLQYLAIGTMVGSVKSLAGELKELGVDTHITDGGAAFEKAVAARFADLRSKGLMPVADRRGRYQPGPNVASSGHGSSGTLWSRMGITK